MDVINGVILMNKKLDVSIIYAQESNADALAMISKKAFDTDAELGDSRTLSKPPNQEVPQVMIPQNFRDI